MDSFFEGGLLLARWLGYVCAVPSWRKGENGIIKSNGITAGYFKACSRIAKERGWKRTTTWTSPDICVKYFLPERWEEYNFLSQKNYNFDWGEDLLNNVIFKKGGGSSKRYTCGDGRPTNNVSGHTEGPSAVLMDRRMVEKRQYYGHAREKPLAQYLFWVAGYE